MTGNEIKQKIDANNRALESMLDPTKFVLSKEIQELVNENLKLQNQCPHSFDKGYCVFCNMRRI